MSDCHQGDELLRGGDREGIKIEATPLRNGDDSVGNKRVFVHRLSDAVSTRLCDVDLEVEQVSAAGGLLNTSNSESKSLPVKKSSASSTVTVVKVHNGEAFNEDSKNIQFLSIPKQRLTSSESDIRTEIPQKSKDLQNSLSYSGQLIFG